MKRKKGGPALKFLSPRYGEMPGEGDDALSIPPLKKKGKKRGDQTTAFFALTPPAPALRERRRGRGRGRRGWCSSVIASCCVTYGHREEKKKREEQGEDDGDRYHAAAYRKGEKEKERKSEERWV